MHENEELPECVTDLEKRVTALEATVQAEKERAKTNLRETLRIVLELAAAVGIKIEIETSEDEPRE
jgi:hypothetical protein